MNFKDHIIECKKTFNYAVGKDGADDLGKDIEHCVFGMMEEAGELCGKIKKHIGYGHKLDKVGIAEELGDYAYYFSMCFDLMLFNTEENKEIVYRMNLLVTINQKPKSKKPVPHKHHADALYKHTAMLVAQMEAHDADQVMAIYENIIQVMNMLSVSIGSTLQKVLDGNIAKLRKRYGKSFKKEATHEQGRDRKEELSLVESRTSKPKPSKRKPRKN